MKNANKHIKHNLQRFETWADNLAHGCDDLPDSTLRALEGKGKRASANRSKARLETILRDTLTWSADE